MSKKIHESVKYIPMDANGTVKRSRGVTYKRPTESRRALRRLMGISNRSFRKMGLNRNFRAQ